MALMVHPSRRGREAECLSRASTSPNHPPPIPYCRRGTSCGSRPSARLSSVGIRHLGSIVLRPKRGTGQGESEVRRPALGRPAIPPSPRWRSGLSPDAPRGPAGRLHHPRSAPCAGGEGYSLRGAGGPSRDPHHSTYRPTRLRRSGGAGVLGPGGRVDLRGLSAYAGYLQTTHLLSRGRCSPVEPRGCGTGPA